MLMCEAGDLFYLDLSSPLLQDCGEGLMSSNKNSDLTVYILLAVNFPLVGVVEQVKKSHSLSGTGNAQTHHAVNKGYSLLLLGIK